MWKFLLVEFQSTCRLKISLCLDNGCRRQRNNEPGVGSFGIESSCAGSGATSP